MKRISCECFHKLSSSEDTKQSGSIDEAVNFFVVFFLFLKGVRFGKSKLQ